MATSVVCSFYGFPLACLVRQERKEKRESGISHVVLLLSSFPSPFSFTVCFSSLSPHSSVFKPPHSELRSSLRNFNFRLSRDSPIFSLSPSLSLFPLVCSYRAYSTAKMLSRVSQAARPLRAIARQVRIENGLEKRSLSSFSPFSTLTLFGDSCVRFAWLQPPPPRLRLQCV